MQVEVVKELNPSELYLVMSLERKLEEFQNVTLAELNQQLKNVETQRSSLVTQINQVQGAIIGGQIMINEELERAGVKPETYFEQKAELLKTQETPGKVLNFPTKGNNDETAETTADDTAGSSPGQPSV